MKTTEKKKEGLFANLKHGSKVIIEDRYSVIVCRHNKSVVRCNKCLDALTTQVAAMCRWVFFDRAFDLRYLCTTCCCGGSKFDHCANVVTTLKKNCWLVGMVSFSVELTMTCIANRTNAADKYVGFANQNAYKILPITKCGPTNTPFRLLTSGKYSPTAPKKKFLQLLGGDNAKRDQKQV